MVNKNDAPKGNEPKGNPDAPVNTDESKTEISSLTPESVIPPANGDEPSNEPGDEPKDESEGPANDDEEEEEVQQVAAGGYPVYTFADNLPPPVTRKEWGFKNFALKQGIVVGPEDAKRARAAASSTTAASGGRLRFQSQVLDAAKAKAYKAAGIEAKAGDFVIVRVA